MNVNEFEFETLIPIKTKSKYYHKVWLTKHSTTFRLCALNISTDIADELNINDDKTHRFDLQISKDGKTFCLYFNSIGVCDMKRKRCVNVHLCDLIKSKLMQAYSNDYENITEFDAYTDVESSRIIFTPIIKETDNAI